MHLFYPERIGLYVAVATCGRREYTAGKGSERLDISAEGLMDMPLFAGIGKDELQAVLHCLQAYTKKFSKRKYLSFEQQEVKSVGVVLSGCVHMVKEDVWGNSTILAVMGPHELFGETFCCGSDPMASVTFVAAAESEILFLPFRRVMRTCEHSCLYHHRLIENMVTEIADKNHALMDKLEAVAQKSLREKILSYLSLQAQKQNRTYFEIPLGRVELADYLCADRSALTRELNSMREAGLIDFEKNTFRLL